jgi:hypothetical protein
MQFACLKTTLTVADPPTQEVPVEVNDSDVNHVDGSGPAGHS